MRIISRPPTKWIGGIKHCVQFYESDNLLADSIIDFTKLGDTAIIVATPEHRKTIEKKIKLRDQNYNKKIHTQYLFLDASQTLATFMVNGMPDPVAFPKTVKAIIDVASSGNRKVRIFGEMVAILWKEGNTEAALKLESLWNDLQKAETFLLMCAYPMSNVKIDEGNADDLSRICNHHSGISSID